MSDEPEQELKGGRPPAVKVGGMRVTQHKPHKEEKERKSSEASGGGDEEEFPAEEKPKKKEQTQLLISGAPARGDKDFPAEAVKAFHEKPHPTHEKAPSHSGGGHGAHFIQQPKRGN